jgi:hypothetical protein
MLAIWLMLACTGETSGVTDGAGADGGGDGGDDGGGPNLDAPTIVAFDVFCCNPAAGPEAWYWTLTAQVSDPQGVETIADIGSDSGHEVNVYNGPASGQPFAEYGAGFSCDDKGVCDTSWQQSADNVMCSSASDYTIELIVADQDGNRSDAAELPGEERGC